MSISWAWKAPRSLTLVKRVGLVGKMRMALAALAGEPPAQLGPRDHWVLKAPVHWCVAGVRRFSRASSAGRKEARWPRRFPRPRPPIEGAPRPQRLNRGSQVDGIIAFLLLVPLRQCGLRYNE